MKSESEITRKRSRVLICECDQSLAQFHLRVYGHKRVHSHAPNDKTCSDKQSTEILEEVSIL